METITLRDLKEYIKMAEEEGMTDDCEVRVCVKASNSEGGFVAPPSNVGMFDNGGGKMFCISAMTLDEDMLFKLLKEATGVQ